MTTDLREGAIDGAGQADIRGAFSRLRPRERALFWTVVALFAFTHLAVVLIPANDVWRGVWFVLQLLARLLVLVMVALGWRSRASGPERQGLGAFALAAMIDALAFVLFAFPDALQFSVVPTRLPLGDLLQLLAYTVITCGLLLLSRQPKVIRSMQVAAFDALITVGAFGLLVWFYLIDRAPAYGGYGAVLGAVTELGYPILDLAMVLALILAMRSGARALTGMARRTLTFSVLALFVGDGLLGIALYILPHAWVLALASSVHVAALVGLGLFGLFARRRLEMPVTTVQVQSPAEQTLSPVSAGAAGMALIAMLFEEIATRQESEGNFTLVASVAVLGLVVILRQLVASRLNALWLLGQQDRLEHEVKARTADLAAAKEALERLATTDQLTGVANRRRFDQVMEEVTASCRRAGEPLGLLLIDIDAFKAYNDHYGHQGGDDCLRAVAEAMAREVGRETDTLARFGGEEFAVICPGTPEQGLLVLGERLRAAVERLGMEHQASNYGRVVTISVGAASITPSRHLQDHDLVSFADQALYAAKAAGRNRVEAFSRVMGGHPGPARGG
ncbi:MAG: diguanylate cyclase [Steroidobacteraceae bacterium]